MGITYENSRRSKISSKNWDILIVAGSCISDQINAKIKWLQKHTPSK